MRSLAITLIFTTLAAGGMLGCRKEGAAERAGEAIDQAGEDTKEALGDAGEAVKDTAEDAHDAVE
jgi:hypothetical protein